MPRPRKNESHHFDAEAFGLFIKTVREAQDKSLVDIARDVEVNRQALYNLERGSNLPSIRTIEAVCSQIGLDPLVAIEAGFGLAPGCTVGKRHFLAETLQELSDDDLALTMDFVKMLRGRQKLRQAAKPSGDRRGSKPARNPFGSDEPTRSL